MIASGGDDKTVKLWNLQGKEIKTLSGHKKLCYRHQFQPGWQDNCQ
jgi:WD40 repeat protein